MKFYVGQRVRLRVNAYHSPETAPLAGRETIIVDRVADYWMLALIATNGYPVCALDAALEPIQPLGTWEETFRGVDFDIRAPVLNISVGSVGIESDHYRP